jgi:peptide/nickel transport system ATP-binding protein
VRPAADSIAAPRPLLEIDNLRTWFDTPRGVLRAVDGVSLALDRGATLGIVGESGSGKSVLVRSVMNLLPDNAIVPPGGTVHFDGRDVRALTDWEAKHFWGKEIAMIFQDPMTSLNPVKRIGTQVTESMRYHLGLSKRAAVDRALDLLNQVRIPEPRRRLEQYPHELSGGMRQRVTIAIALSCEPRLLIADEPTTALDVTVQKQILDLLAQLQQDHRMAMILITHDLGVVAGQADRVAVMYAGQIVEEAATIELFDHLRHPYTEALLHSIPRLQSVSHVRLDAIGGRPPDMVRPPAGCRFAPRCRYAQDRCLAEDPILLDEDGSGHLFRCWFPVGTSLGTQAWADNRAAGRTAAGLTLDAVVGS